MKMIVDTREKPQAIKGILTYFDRKSIEVIREALPIGDYMIEGQPRLIVDRKHDLRELATNLLSRDRARFYREVRRARAAGVRLVILCEEAGIGTYRDVVSWQTEYGKVSGKALADAIYRLEVAYGVQTFFCDRRSTGKRILEILTEGEAGD